MLLHDSHNEFYRTPSGPAPVGSNVLIRLHCDEATSVVLRTWMTEELCYTMLPTAEHVWEVAIPLPTTPGLFWYYFLIYRKDGRTIRYGNQPDKLGGVGVAYDHGEPESFQITLYDPAYKTPEAFHGANIYQIFPDRFRHAPTKAVDDRKDRYVHQNWDEELLGVGDLRGGKYQELDFYGGTLTGIQEKLPYLKDMGIDIIYLNPIFRARSNHRYDTGDYTQVDPLCGTNTEFTELCEAAKKVGIRVMLDGVFSHTGEDSVYFNHFGHYPTLGAYQGQSSPYYDWYTFNHYPEDYKAWWGILSLPELRKDNPEYQKFMFQPHEGVVPRWIEAGSCGWRLDVAADLGHSPEFNHKFWKEFRRVVKEANPEAIILAEHYGDAMSWLQGDEWDTVMNYDAFMEPVSWFLTGMEKHSDEFNQGLLGNSESFIGAMTYHMPAFYAPSLYTAMNELDNHDHSRFLTRTNHRVGRVANVGPYAAAENTNKAVLREAVVIQMTWPGAPTLYYGDEAGQVGFTDPDNRRTYPWGQEDQELIRFYKEMIAVHRRFPVLAMGSLKFLYHDYNVLSYGRFNQEEQVIVVINNRNERVHVEIPVWLTGINRSSVAKLTQVFATDAVGFSSEEKEIEAPAGILEMDLLPLSGVVLHRCEE